MLVLQKVNLANYLSSSWVTTCGSFVVGYFRACTLNLAPFGMTASMGSSHHVFLSPRVQLNVHVAQTSMWLLGVRSLHSHAKCRGGAPQRAFIRNAAQLYKCAFTRSQYGFHAAVGALVFIYFVAKCRHDLLIGAR